MEEIPTNEQTELNIIMYHSMKHLSQVAKEVIESVQNHEWKSQSIKDQVASFIKSMQDGIAPVDAVLKSMEKRIES